MAFHPYPQLIPQFFNIGGFGPPRGINRASSWPWIDHLASGLPHATQVALLRLAFATASPHTGLTVQHRVTHRLIMQKARRQDCSNPKVQGHPPTACRHTVSGTISLSLQEYFSPFPHGTSSLSVTEEYFALGGGPPGFPQDFSCPVVLGNQITGVRYRFAYGAFTLSGQSFQNCSTTVRIGNSLTDLHFHQIWPHDPGRTTHAGFNIRTGLGCFPFARRY